MPKKVAVVKQKKKANGYKFPEHIPSGFVVQDTQKKEWVIQDTIGNGGFGEIYSANLVKDTSSAKNKSYYAIKVEPKENGPLYVEMHFNMRVCKEDDIRAWMKKINVKSFGMPIFHGSGSFEYKSNEYRFIVTDRLQTDLQSILSKCSGQLPLNTVLQIGIQVINVLVYIHSKNYIHGDIKAANLMFGMRPGTENTVYLIDFGLAAKCTITDKEFVKEPKKAHNGTIEYISRDGHSGIFGFRGDLEILGFNLLHWLNGSLPWEKCLSDPTAVEQMKIELMKDPAKYIKKHLLKVPEELKEFLQYIASLKNNDIPEYDHCKGLLGKRLAVQKIAPYGKLVLTNVDSVNDKVPTPGRGRKKAVTTSKMVRNSPKKRLIESKAGTEEEDVEGEPTSKKRMVESDVAGGSTDTNGVFKEKAKQLMDKTKRTKASKKQLVNEENLENEELTSNNAFANSEEKRLLEKVASKSKATGKPARSKAANKRLQYDAVEDEKPELESEDSTTRKGIANKEEQRLLDKIASKAKSSSKTKRTFTRKK